MAITSNRVAESERPEGLQDFVSRRLVRAIVSGELPPGDRLSPARLAEDFGVSHIPVREALAALEVVGHVQRIPRVGFFVAELSSEDIEDIYHWRRVLEGEAHRVAVPILTDDDLVRMRELYAGMLTPIKERDSSVDINRLFHFVPFERVGSPHLLRFLTHLWDSAARYQNAMSFVRVPKTLQQEHHAALMRGFEARDADEVNLWMDKHRQVTLEAIRKIQRDNGEKKPVVGKPPQPRPAATKTAPRRRPAAATTPRRRPTAATTP